MIGQCPTVRRLCRSLCSLWGSKAGVKAAPFALPWSPWCGPSPDVSAPGNTWRWGEAFTWRPAGSWWFNRKLKIMRPRNWTWQYQLEHIILPSLLVCFLQSWGCIPILSDIGSGTKVLHLYELQTLYSVHMGMWAAEVCCFGWKREPFQPVHSLPNGVWLHSGETAWTFAPENMSQNSWSEHLSCGGLSLIIILNGGSPPVWPTDTQKLWAAIRSCTSWSLNVSLEKCGNIR